MRHRWKFEGPDEPWHEVDPSEANPRLVALKATEGKPEGLYKIVVESMGRPGNRYSFRVRVGDSRTFVTMVFHQEYF